MTKIHRALVAAALFAAAPAFAAAPLASIDGIEGTVLVKAGDEFVTATDAQALQAGDQVMLMEGASAQITFNDGCVLEAQPGSMIVVPEQSTCAGAQLAMQPVGAQFAQAVGEGGAGVSALTQALIIGGVVLTVGFVVEGDDDEPVSP
ncbi:hypothetical protein [Arenimonas composti]|uniref:FecR protein domain-containing protein n=1 Tax=Arenimonas composti TR7-09 = DSM 18010 TaxID=1121013 RepID=A0A091BDG9_9GAMM|nr:hypothetical protein [Arenimonas composti]KFN48864.1 hypothetical protein P873_13000 [Arenimonas composti TR7-09 = DSM 18010]